ncbi:MAG TPA: VOC family protein [Opitutaceae bacterium]|jgi:predicted 3-demethylubiquinone-9 3-methyltransferase (glyoxalase superfamily)|nr:VOC family protein [Opitutaceae bacterium]
MPKITPFLWFDKEAEQAANYYTKIFKGSKILAVARNTESTPGKKDSVLTVKFRIMGQVFTALNGGPHYKFNNAVSFVVHCKTQAEVDYYWKKLSAGGEEIQCGWLKDKFGLVWQVVPDVLLELITSKDRAKANRVLGAMMKMVKLDIPKLQAAAKAPKIARK